VGLVAVLAHVEQVFDQHPERRAPVADVVLPDHVVAEALQGAGQGVADHGGAQVPDVHLLGHVRGRVVDDHALRPFAGDTEPVVPPDPGRLGADPGVGEGEVHEAGAADLDALAHVADLEVLHQASGDLARRQPQPLAQRQRGVDLHVGVLARAQHRVRAGVLGAERRLDRPGDAGCEHREGRGHAEKARRPGPGARQGSGDPRLDLDAASTLQAAPMDFHEPAWAVRPSGPGRAG
jgi:hypothetical protein